MSNKNYVITEDVANKHKVKEKEEVAYVITMEDIEDTIDNIYGTSDKYKVDRATLDKIKEELLENNEVGSYIDEALSVSVENCMPKEEKKPQDRGIVFAEDMISTYAKKYMCDGLEKHHDAIDVSSIHDDLHFAADEVNRKLNEAGIKDLIENTINYECGQVYEATTGQKDPYKNQSEAVIASFDLPNEKARRIILNIQEEVPSEVDKLSKAVEEYKNEDDNVYTIDRMDIEDRVDGMCMVDDRYKNITEKQIEEIAETAVFEFENGGYIQEEMDAAMNSRLDLLIREKLGIPQKAVVRENNTSLVNIRKSDISDRVQSFLNYTNTEFESEEDKQSVVDSIYESLSSDGSVINGKIDWIISEAVNDELEYNDKYAGILSSNKDTQERGERYVSMIRKEARLDK